MNIAFRTDVHALDSGELQKMQEHLETMLQRVKEERQNRLLASRPAWARKVGGLIDGENKKRANLYVLVFSILVVLMYTLPPFLNSLIAAGARYQASGYKGVPRVEPTAPSLPVERQ